MGGGLLSRGGACNRLYVFLFTGRWAYNWWGRVIRVGGGRLYPGGLVIGCIFLFTGRWANKWGVGVGEECL